MKKFFQLKERNTTWKRELIGAFCSFLAGSYILAVNPALLSVTGMSPGAVFTATALAAGIATIFMGLLSNLPVFLAAGMGLNAVMAFQICLAGGFSWQGALALFLCEGTLALLLALGNVRSMISLAIPDPIKKAIPVGIGLFIALLGLTNGGALVGDSGTIIGLGNIKSGTPMLTLISIALTFVLCSLKVPGGILIAIIASTVIGIPMGVTVWNGWTPLETPYFGAVFTGFENAFSISGVLGAIIIIITLCITDIFDTVGTAFGITKSAGLVDASGNFPKTKQLFIADSAGTMIASVLGTSSTTSYIESGAGVSAGARTGLSSVFIGILFLLSLFFSPVFLAVPGAATAGALFYVGYLMMKEIGEINFKIQDEGIPAFTCIVCVPFTYSITYGIEMGFIAYVICKSFAGKIKEITLPVWILSAIFLTHLFIWR